MRGWFETLGYRFEKYEVSTSEYFEWIINIPLRRNRYDRILVHGMTGEVGLKDIQALDFKVTEQKTDEGWLVTNRRISKAARDEVDSVENQHLNCFTFDELVASDADFRGYLHWLEAEVKGRYDMMGQTMLIRNADGDYTPAHRSLLEFFVAYKFAGELGVLADDFLEVVRKTSGDDRETLALEFSSSEETLALGFSWGEYFQNHVDEKGKTLALDKPGETLALEKLKSFKSESLEKLRQTFGFQALTKAVLDLLVGMVDKGSGVEKLLKIIEATKGKSEAEVGYVGGNAATLAVKVDNAALEGKDLSGAVVKGADFSDASLNNVDFAGANLGESIFARDLSDFLSVAFSPDGQFLVTGDNSCMVRLWETASGREVLICKGHTRWVTSVAFSCDGNTVASCSADETIKLWDTKTGECLKVFQGHSDWLECVSF